MPEEENTLPQKTELDEYTQEKLKSTQDEIHKKQDEEISKIKKNTSLFALLSFVLLVPSIAFYIYPRVTELQETIAKTQSLEISNLQLEEKKQLMNNELKDLQSQRKTLEEKLGEIFDILLPNINSPSDYEKTKGRIAVFFEDFAISYNTGSSPISIPSVDFQKKPQEEGDYFVLPIKMTIDASEKNFILFLEQINKHSGSQDPKYFYKYSDSGKKEPISIMSIESLNISLPKADTFSLTSEKNTKKDKNLTFTVSINAYIKSTDKMKELYGSKKK